jgi:uncharacterized Zn-binding protein involved in type VI secretion
MSNIGNIGEALGGRAANAGRSAGAPAPPDSWGFDPGGVKMLTGVVKNFANGNTSLGASLMPDPARQQPWHHTSLKGFALAAEQQKAAIGKRLADLFNQSENPPEGVLGHVGAAFGLLTDFEQLATMYLGAIPFPATPAVRVGDFDVGCPHGHVHPPNLVPPAPMVPLPSTGPVLSIPILSGASTVTINDMPAARCGDMGAAVWCGSYVPMYEIFLGSANVWIEGARAARVTVDVTSHCIFSVRPQPSDRPVGCPVGATISSSANVMIGGIPLPSLTNAAVGAAMKLMFKGLGKALGALRKRFGKALNPRAAVVPPGPRPPPLPHARFAASATSLFEAILRNAPGVGDRLVIQHINAGELLALTRATGHEWGVVVQHDGQLALIHGGPGTVPIQAGDHLLVHTHPVVPGAPGTGVAMPSGATGDMGNAADNARIDGWNHPAAVMGHDGNVRYYDQNGVVPDPNNSYVPIGPDGNIDGYHRMPNAPDGTEAVPPRMLNRP